jgi:hypothetical protein
MPQILKVNSKSTVNRWAIKLGEDEGVNERERRRTYLRMDFYFYNYSSILFSIE